MLYHPIVTSGSRTAEDPGEERDPSQRLKSKEGEVVQRSRAV